MKFLDNWLSARHLGGAPGRDYRNELANATRVVGTLLVLAALRLSLWVPPAGEVFAFLCVYLAVGLGTLAAHRLLSQRAYDKVATFQMLADIVTFTMGVHYSGSATTPLIILYPLLVMIVALGWELWRARLAVAAIAVCYGTVLILEARGALPYDPFWPGNGHLELWFANHRIWSTRPRWMYFASVYAAVMGISSVVYLLGAYIMTRLAEAQQTLARQQSLAAVGELVAGAAHALNNPVGSARSLLETLAEDLKRTPSEKLSDALRADLLETTGRVQFAVQRANTVVRDLMDLSRHSLAAREEVDLAVVAQDVVERLKLQHPDKAACLKLRTNGSLPPLEANAQQLAQVIYNLADNALHVVDAGAGEVTVELAGGGALAVVRCRDNGPGMSAEVLENIFRPFFSTKESGKGTGLGLFLCQEIVHRLGGEIEVESTPGRGTHFEVRLPAGR